MKGDVRIRSGRESKGSGYMLFVVSGGAEPEVGTS